MVCYFVSVCTGTKFGLRRTGHAGNWSIQRYIRLYQNCVYVDGNLEITYLENGYYDLSFLSTIQEVFGETFVQCLFFCEMGIVHLAIFVSFVLICLLGSWIHISLVRSLVLLMCTSTSSSCMCKEYISVMASVSFRYFPQI